MKVDLEILRNNIIEMASIALKAELDLRPDYSSHHCPFISQLQIEYGASGISCDCCKDAYTLISYGMRDILIKNYDKDIDLLKDAYARIIVCIDDIKQARHINKLFDDIEVQIKVTNQSKEEILTFIQEIKKCKHLDFAGLYFVPYIDKIKFEQRYDEAYDHEIYVKEYIEYINQHNIDVDIISGLSTTSVHFRQDKYFDTYYNEITCGKYALMDSELIQYDLPFKEAIIDYTDSKCIELVADHEVIDTLEIEE